MIKWQPLLAFLCVVSLPVVLSGCSTTGVTSYSVSYSSAKPYSYKYYSYPDRYYYLHYPNYYYRDRYRIHFHSGKPYYYGRYHHGYYGHYYRYKHYRYNW